MENSLEILQTVYRLPFVISRMLTAFMVLPFFNRELLSKNVCLSLAISFMLPLLTKVLPDNPEVPQSAVLLFPMLLKEVFVGLLIGFSLCAPFWAVQNAGDFLDTARGANSAMINDSLIGTQTLPHGVLFYHLMIVMFIICGGMRDMIASIHESYTIWPIDRVLPQIDYKLVNFGTQVLARVLFLAIMISAPMVIASLTVDLGMGLINRVASNLNVYSLAMPAKSLVSSLVLIFFTYIFFRIAGREILPGIAVVDTLKAVLN